MSISESIYPAITMEVYMPANHCVIGDLVQLDGWKTQDGK